MNLTPVQSSAVKAIGHQGDTLYVEFASGVYALEGVSAEQFDALFTAKSIGAAVNALKSQCTACRKVEADDATVAERAKGR